MRARRAWAAWVRLLSTEEAPTALAIFRILIGLTVVVTFLLVLAEGAVPTFLDRAAGGARSLSGKQWLVAALGGAVPEAVYPLLAVAILGGAAVTMGLGGFLAPLLTLQACIALFSINASAGGGHDRLLTNALWLLCLGPSARTLSVDCRLRNGTWTDPTPRLAWTRYVAIVQLAVVYGATGLQKLGAEWFPWGDWSALYYALLLPSWQRWEVVPWVARLYPLTQVGTAVTWIWEVSWPLVVLSFWFRRTRTRGGRLRALSNRLDPRRAYTVVALFMHGGAWALMNLGPFSAVTLAFYPCLFHPDEWAAVLRRRR